MNVDVCVYGVKLGSLNAVDWTGGAAFVLAIKTGKLRVGRHIPHLFANFAEMSLEVSRKGRNGRTKR